MRKKTIEHARLAAEAHGGECLSVEYKNNKTKMQWRCSEGHEWEANANGIWLGHWCPICAIDATKSGITYEERLELIKQKRKENPSPFRETEKRYRSEHPEVKREWMLKKKYGMTIADYNKKLEEQGNCCAICNKNTNLPDESFHVDHNHATGAIRGLLCQRCNLRLGFIEDADFYGKAMDYLNAYDSPTFDCGGGI